MVIYPGAQGLAHPIHHGGPVDRPGAPQSGGSGLAQAILAGQEKMQPVNPGSRSSRGGLHALLAAAAQRAMEQKAQMAGSYTAPQQRAMHALQQQSANLHSGGY